MLSTSRVYHIPSLLKLPLRSRNNAFELDDTQTLPAGCTSEGISEAFPVGSPCSLYGATKCASEQMSLEYGQAYDFPVWINRCGVLAGAGQFGKADQGIFSYWIHSWLAGKPLKYIGFQGSGHQVRDCLHPADLQPLIDQQLTCSRSDMAAEDRLINVSGGSGSAMSLKQLSDWCTEHLKTPRQVSADLTPRRFDLPWVVLDATRASACWNWRPRLARDMILEQIARHAHDHPDWLSVSRDH
jgi:CDP-paratose 2-epimerase